jgi:hypothetical protein
MSSLSAIYSSFRTKTFDDIAAITSQVEQDSMSLSDTTKAEFATKLLQYFTSHTFKGADLSQASWTQFSTSLSSIAKKELNAAPSKKDELFKLVHEIQTATARKIEGLPRDIEPVILTWHAPDNEKTTENRKPEEQERCGKDEKQECSHAAQKRVKVAVVSTSTLPHQFEKLIKDGEIDLSELQTESAFVAVVCYARARDINDKITLDNFIEVYMFIVCKLEVLLQYKFHSFFEKQMNTYKENPTEALKDALIKVLDALLQNLEFIQSVGESSDYYQYWRFDLMSNSEIALAVQNAEVSTDSSTTSPSKDVATPYQIQFSVAFTAWAKKKIKELEKSKADQFFNECIRPFIMSSKHEYLREILTEYIDSKCDGCLNVTQKNLGCVTTGELRVSFAISLIREHNLGSLFDSVSFLQKFDNNSQLDAEFFSKELKWFFNELLFSKQRDDDYVYFPKKIVIGLKESNDERIEAATIVHAQAALTAFIAEKNLQDKLAHITIEVVDTNNRAEFAPPVSRLPQSAFSLSRSAKLLNEYHLKPFYNDININKFLLSSFPTSEMFLDYKILKIPEVKSSILGKLKGAFDNLFSRS